MNQNIGYFESKKIRKYRFYAEFIKSKLENEASALVENTNTQNYINKDSLKTREETNNFLTRSSLEKKALDQLHSKSQKPEIEEVS